MALLENFRLFWQVAMDLHGLRVDMRRNAQGYKDALARFDVARIAGEMDRDAQAFLRRLARLKALNDSTERRQKIGAVITSLGGTLQEIGDSWQELKAATDALIAAPKTTSAEIIQASDAVLSSVSFGDSLF